MHTTRRHPAVFAGCRKNPKRGPSRAGNDSPKKYLFVIIRDRIRQIFTTPGKKGSRKTGME